MGLLLPGNCGAMALSGRAPALFERRTRACCGWSLRAVPSPVWLVWRPLVGFVPADVTILVPVVVAAYFSGATIGPCTWLLEE
jgi:hypothetical protein